MRGFYFGAGFVGFDVIGTVFMCYYSGYIMLITSLGFFDFLRRFGGAL